MGMDHRDKDTETRTHITTGYMALIPVLQIKTLRLQRSSRFPWVTTAQGLSSEWGPGLENVS